MLKLTRDSSGAVEFIELSEAERLCGRENYDFYCFLIWPFIETTWLGSVSLLGLTPPVDGLQDVWLDMKKVQDNAQFVRSLRCFPFRLSEDFPLTNRLLLLLAWKNVILPRRLALFRGFKQRNFEEFISAL